jgi:nucleoside 2-deoxyribosyltransferase
MTVYLCGGINGLTDDQATTWREYAKARLNCECLDPMRRDYRGVEDQNVDAIVQGDLRDIDACETVLVNATRPSWGTAMEIVYAYQSGKRIVTCVGDSSVSPWLRYHSTSIHTSLDSAISEIERTA